MLAKIISRLTLLVFSLVITLVLLEFIARLIPLWPDQVSNIDPQLGFAHVPNATGWWVNISNPFEFRSWITISSQGLHDREFRIEKPDGVTRILFLGDSVVDGLEVPQEANSTKQLERLFREAGYQVEVINGGHYGYGTDQELLFYRYKGRNFKPDVVILGFLAANDVQDNISPYALGNAKPYFELASDGSLILKDLQLQGSSHNEPAKNLLKLTKQFLYDHSKLYKFIGYQIKLRFPQGKGILAKLSLISDDSSPNLDQEIGFASSGMESNEDLEQGWRLTEAIIRQLKTEVEKDGAVFVVVNLPHILYSTAPSQDGHFGMALPDDYIVEFCTQKDFHCLDLFPAFSKYMGENTNTSLFYRFDKHPTVEGHSLIAKTLYDYLQQILSLTPSSH